MCPVLYQGGCPLDYGAAKLDFWLRSDLAVEPGPNLGCSCLSLPAAEITGPLSTAVCCSGTHTLLYFNVDAALDRDTEGDLLLGDMGQGIPFRPGSFDGCIR